MVVLGKHVVEACLVFEQVVHAGLVEQRPFHMRDESDASGSGGRAGLELLFDQGQHGVLVETISPEVRLLPQPHVQLA